MQFVINELAGLDTLASLPGYEDATPDMVEAILEQAGVLANEVFSPITKDYWKAINNRDNLCALAPANPAIAAFLSPWSIGVGRPTTKDELDRVDPQITAFHEHCLNLAHDLRYKGPAGQQMVERDRKHLDCFFDDALDPRAWKGVYGVIGESLGQKAKQIFKTAIR